MVEELKGWVGFIDDVGGQADGLMSCMESLGFESCVEQRFDDGIGFCEGRKASTSGDGRARSGRERWRERKKKFLPPLSSLNQNDGKLKFTEVRIERPKTLSSAPSCSCPDRTSPCKHILFVLIRALGVPLGVACLRRRTIPPYQLGRLLHTPTLPESLAGAGLRERFHQLFFRSVNQGGSGSGSGSGSEIRNIHEGAVCPICLDEMEKGEKLSACATCRNLIHEECWKRWKRSRGRRSASCVICRARWRERTTQNKYLNLTAYVIEDGEDGGGGGGFCGG